MIASQRQVTLRFLYDELWLTEDAMADETLCEVESMDGQSIDVNLPLTGETDRDRATLRQFELWLESKIEYTKMELKIGSCTEYALKFKISKEK